MLICLQKKGMSSGISYIAHRYSHAISIYMIDYNENEKNKYLMYLVANNLYEWAICNLDFYQQVKLGG